MFKLPKRSKHNRKLRKKAEKLRRNIKVHEKAQRWHVIKINLYRKKVKIEIERINEAGNPQRKQAVIGLKEELNLNRFLGKFQTQEKKK